MRPLVMEFVECIPVLCIGIKTWQCASLHAYPCSIFLYPFLSSFLIKYSFLSNFFQDQCVWNVYSWCYVVTCACWATHLDSHCPVSSSLTPSPPPLLSTQFNLTPSLGQSLCVQTRGWGEEGDWRRRDHLWDIGLSSQPPPWCIARSFWDTWVTGLVLLHRTS